MKYLPRLIEPAIQKYLSSFPAIALTGPRQSGKSTTLKKKFISKYMYVSFDDPLLVKFFEDDPKGFLLKYPNKIIFDEVQRVPQLFNYLKIAIDEDRMNYGKFILTGSAQFSLLKSITESLAGRIGLLSLLPFSREEIPSTLQKDQILKGSYPELVIRRYQNNAEWYGAYITNYIERDVRSVHNIGNLSDFRKLLALLAARTSQELNMSKLGSEIGANTKTIQAWISVMEASYIIFLLPSYHKNLGKRIVKRPKIYFYDTGLVCYLTGIESHEILEKGPLDGAIFENYVISEIKKIICHKGLSIQMSYFRNNLGLEGDVILEDRKKKTISFIEIKSTATIRSQMIGNLTQLMELEKKSKHILPMTIKGCLLNKGKGIENFGDNISAMPFSRFLASF